MTTAMQYLQGKGLCLMPIALAAAISGGKESSLSPYSDNWKRNIGFTDGGTINNENNSKFRANAIHHNKPCDGNAMIDKLCRGSTMVNKCNDAVAQPQKILEYNYCNSHVRELKPKI